jgi:quinol monooxygenase YgiN
LSESHITHRFFLSHSSHVLCSVFFTQYGTKRQVPRGVNGRKHFARCATALLSPVFLIGFYLVKLYSWHWVCNYRVGKPPEPVTNEEKMTYMAMFTFEVAKENQQAYLKTTWEVIKPFWEANECLSYEVFQDYFTNSERFVKIQFYKDKETMERSLASARQDPRGQEIVAMFMQYIKPDTLEQRRVVPRIDKSSMVG